MLKTVAISITEEMIPSNVIGTMLGYSRVE